MRRSAAGDERWSAGLDRDGEQESERVRAQLMVCGDCGRLVQGCAPNGGDTTQHYFSRLVFALLLVAGAVLNAN